MGVVVVVTIVILLCLQCSDDVIWIVVSTIHHQKCL